MRVEPPRADLSASRLFIGFIADTGRPPSQAQTELPRELIAAAIIGLPPAFPGVGQRTKRGLLATITRCERRSTSPAGSKSFVTAISSPHRRLHEAGIIKSSPQKIIAEGTDWRFLDELKRELKT